MRKLRIIACLAAAVFMTACGGGPTLSGTPAPVGGGSVAKVTVSASSSTIAVDGTTSSTITATVLNANNAGVSGQTVTFGSSTGGAIAVVSATTSASGVATATLSNNGAAAGTSLTVTAAAGGVSGTTTVGVVAIQQSLSLQTSLPSIPSDSSKAATISAVLRDANNNALAGTTVQFSATSGVLAVTTPVTNANGIAQATLTAGTDPSTRTITVTATAGSSKATIAVAVNGTSLSIAGPANLVLGSPGTYTVALTNSGGTPIPGQTITLTSALGNAISPATLTTTADGSAQSFTLTATKGGAETISASGLGQVATYGVSISTQNFAFTAPANLSKVNLGATGTLTVNWSSNGVPVANTPVSFQATRGTLSAASVTTDSSGNATVTITSSTAGPSVVSAGGTAPGSTTVAAAQLSLDFVATQPATLGMQASPATIATQASSTITATVRDANNNLVEGQVVDFSIVKDSTGGSLSVASATTNSQGQATTTYTASTTTSATNGISISGTAAGTSVAGSISLTVGGQTVFLSLGTGNTISPLSATQYSQPWSVQAVDAAGNGVNGVSITFAVTSLGYGKGSRVWNGTFWQTIYNTAAGDRYDYTLNGNNGCRTEDLIGNGVLEPGEDYNNNGKLDPGLVASTDVASATTANGGSASFNLVYPKDHAFWVAVQLTATATVSGTQSSSSNVFWLEGLAGDFDTQNVDPPGYNSPYGVAATCANPN